MSLGKWKKKLSVNLKAVKCPECGIEQPKVRKPKGMQEILWGGSTCKECGCKMDKQGKKRIKFNVSSLFSLCQAQSSKKLASFSLIR